MRIGARHFVARSARLMYLSRQNVPPAFFLDFAMLFVAGFSRFFDVTHQPVMPDLFQAVSISFGSSFSDVTLSVLFFLGFSSSLKSLDRIHEYVFTAIVLFPPS